MQLAGAACEAADADPPTCCHPAAAAAAADAAATQIYVATAPEMYSAFGGWEKAFKPEPSRLEVIFYHSPHPTTSPGARCPQDGLIETQEY